VGLNAEANALSVTVWQYDLLDEQPLIIDVVLAGDVCYEKPMAARVLPWLRSLHASGVRVLLADPGRAYFPVREFVLLAEYDIPTSRDLEDEVSKHTGVYTFRSPAAPGTAW
jgi:predicted nicotinamide N-methyase